MQKEVRSSVMNSLACLLAVAFLVGSVAACGTTEDGGSGTPGADAATDSGDAGGDVSVDPDVDSPDGGAPDTDEDAGSPDTGPLMCSGDNPEGCTSDADCGAGARCADVDACLPSSCECDADSGMWVCTEDCGGGRCMPIGEPQCFVDEDCADEWTCEAGTCQACLPVACDNECAPGYDFAERNGCLTCSCEPIRECEADGDCSEGGQCVGTGLCTDLCVDGDPACCEASYCEGGACEGPNPEGCISTGCGEGFSCQVTRESCTSSGCTCDPATGSWLCTPDCSGGECVALPTDCEFDTDCPLYTICEGGACMDALCPRIYAPVCGVDGVTYSNDCEARRAHVGVASVGECEAIACNVDSDCGFGFICVANVCQGDIGCADVWDPVCGSDGVTYGNECEARRAGVDVVGSGACDPPGEGEGGPCTSDTECEIGLLCREGFCAGVVCPAIYDPVCGVDGVTYGNACTAAAAHVEVQSEGECLGEPCMTNADCPRGEVCPIGGDGTCAEPCGIFCLIPDPVCGTDGNTYGCGTVEAHCNGVEVDYEGPCERP